MKEYVERIALKGHVNIAQGNALGKQCNLITSL